MNTQNTNNQNKRVTLVVPAHNEEKNIQVFTDAILAVFKPMLNYDYELIFINDGSNDNTDLAIDKATSKDENIKAIHFTRNFGKEAATSAGIHHASGDCIIIMDSDMQHPVELVPEFIKKWEEGNDVVVGKVKTSKSSFHKKVSRVIFYKLIKAMSDEKIDMSGNDFRLIDKSVADSFKNIKEGNRTTRTIIDWLGYKRETVMFTPNSRAEGDASYNTRQLIRLAINTLMHNSLLPLKIAGYFGSILFVIMGLLGTFIIIEKYIMGDPLSLGFSAASQLAVLNTFLISFVLICIGFMSMYIGNIHSEVRGRPLYIIKKYTKVKRI